MRNLLHEIFKFWQPAPVFVSAGDNGKPVIAQMSKETIEAERRRRDGSGPTGRADAPQRQRPGTSRPTVRPVSGGSGSGGGGIFSSGGSSSSGGGSFQLPTNFNIPKLPWWMWLIILVGGAIFIFFILPNMNLDMGNVSQPGNYDNNNNYVEEPTMEVPTFVAPTAVAGKGQTWTIMLYMDADDEALEKDIFIDLNEVERIGSTDRVRIVAQVDRFRGGYSGSEDWSSTRRYYVTQDDDLNSLGSQLVADLGEVNMADGTALEDFVEWGAANFPADNYVLILSDHGMGWPGGWVDPAPGGSADNNSPLAQRLGNMLYLNELDQVLGRVRSQAGIDKFEIIGMDACLMGQVEVFAALAPHARYAVASQEIEPALGWAYTAFLEKLEANPDMSSAELAVQIVQTYIDEDQRVQDDQARRDFLGNRDMSASMLANQLGKDVTLTAVDLSKIDDLMLALNDLSFALQSADSQTVAKVRNYTHSFTNVFGSSQPSGYLDLGNMAAFLNQESGDATVERASERLLQALDDAVLYEKHGPKQNGSSGIAIYFPNSTLYDQAISGPESYTAIASRFAQESLWDDFLAYHYTGRAFKADDAAAVVPDIGAALQTPGAGSIKVSNLRLSSDTASPGEAVTLSADIKGKNIGYIYLFVGYYDEASNSVFVADMDYLESGDTRQLNGVFYPEWSQDFTLQYTWDPTIFSIGDGQNTYWALFEPQSFGATYEDAVYTVDGTYTFASTGKSQFAQLYFSNEELTHVYGFSGDGATGAPREITPQAGDTFTLKERWFDLSSSGEFQTTTVLDGQTLTFGSQRFTWEQQYAAAGPYVIGFIVEDLDGKRTGTYTQITVE